MPEAAKLQTISPTTSLSIPDNVEKDKPKATPSTTLKLTNLLKVAPKKDQQTSNEEEKIILDNPYSAEQLRAAWMEFAELRKMYQAEYHLLVQAYDLTENTITVRLLHPVQETMLNNMKIELSAFLRERVKNNTIVVRGELQLTDDKKIVYTNREKFEYLAEKNPLLNELKDRLGLDVDF